MRPGLAFLIISPMRTAARLTSLALAACLAGQATAAPLDAARREELEKAQPAWTETKARARRMSDAFLDNVKKSPNQAKFQKHIEKTWELFDAIETRETSRRSRLRTKLQLLRTDGKITAAESRRRSEALDKVYRNRMLFIYGGSLPRILDEAVTDARGNRIGRQYAGPEWRIEITEDEFRELAESYNRACGFSEAELNAP